MPKIKPIHFIALLVIMTLMHTIASLVGHYEQKPIWVDKILHTMAGASMAMLGGWILQNFFAPALNDNSRFETVAMLLLFAFVMAIAWELAEFVFMETLPALALSLRLYSPTIFDALTDIVANMIGGGLFVAVAFRQRTLR